ncbi:hypothetical protein D1007_13962 [Hordeum vulgare]|nr:hypothetical protein D1007_13962 [Hordeum vulgare]
MQGSVSFDPSQMVIISGATPAMEILSFCIADPGNAFLVPSQYYPGWDTDIKWRTSIELIPVPCRSTDNFNIKCLEKVAKTVSFLARPEGSFLLLLTGEVQKDSALELLNVRPSTSFTYVA